MIMKRIPCLMVLATALSHACAQNTNQPPREWKVILNVVDEAQQPVPGAEVKIWYHVRPAEGETIAFDKRVGITDSNGVFSASGPPSFELPCEAQKQEYYAAGKSYELGPAFLYDPAKWSPTIALLAKRVVKPVTMYAKLVVQEPPVLNEPVGFDLAEGDWVAPQGKGSVKDFVFTKNLSLKSTSDYEGKIQLTFSNEGDGIQLYEPTDLEKTSSLKSPHHAPENGYRPELTRETSAHPGQPSKFEYDPKRIYFFRVRTVLDKKGN